MAALPAYVRLGWRDAAEQPKPVVVRSEMERGIAKQRRIAADTVVTMPLTLYFDTAADAANFETWFYTDINGGASWFDFTSMRTGGTVQARFVGGEIGKLVPTNKTWGYSMRQTQIEFVRQAS